MVLKNFLDKLIYPGAPHDTAGLLGLCCQVVEVDHVLLLYLLIVHFNLDVGLDYLTVVHGLVVDLEQVPLGTLPCLLLLLHVGDMEQVDDAQVLDPILFFFTHNLCTFPVFSISSLSPSDIIAAFLEMSKFLAAGALDIKGLALFILTSFGSSTEFTL